MRSPSVSSQRSAAVSESSCHHLYHVQGDVRSLVVTTPWRSAMIQPPFLPQHMCRSLESTYKHASLLFTGGDSHGVCRARQLLRLGLRQVVAERAHRIGAHPGDRGPNRSGIFCEELYHRDESNVPEGEHPSTDYSHPKSLEQELRATHVFELRAGKRVQVPPYDYVRHARSGNTVTTTPTRIIMVEGILLFTNAELCKAMDCLIFVGTPLDICLIRRAERDAKERGHTFKAAIEQYATTVRRVHCAYAELSKVHVDISAPCWKNSGVAFGVLRVKQSHVLPLPHHRKNVMRCHRSAEFDCALGL
ncbi:uridine kinase-like protein [Leishmania major strain Friedlin]|uniref:Uridine kinase-like protein n=1 Tax=Leishmania major TaxID=5664 RepID=Q4Q614_LEIMA|nr:uridine kinase-like protein [Leishmania major strain Friedlin]CAG9579426.1 ferredoxin_2fe-2s-like_protein [Leishmania major strain Friedlin]CAJ08440.1 uridine kinase-like protein [Leishmania major strain Friedlin]|eukprot:XP_001685234.1 uridine kinase-like protein [Leishmania major strain Friedlin]